MPKIIYKVEAAKLIDRGLGAESGETIHWATVSTEKEAKRIGEKWLKLKDVRSVWIHKEIADSGTDPLYQWSKYKGDKKWSGGDFWGVDISDYE